MLHFLLILKSSDRQSSTIAVCTSMYVRTGEDSDSHPRPAWRWVFARSSSSLRCFAVEHAFQPWISPRHQRLSAAKPDGDRRRNNAT